jgi:hypothetical protein
MLGDRQTLLPIRSEVSRDKPMSDAPRRRDFWNVAKALFHFQQLLLL